MTNDKTRRNEEIQLTKRPERPSPAFCHWDFGFLLSLVIRHWSLTILASSLAVSCSKPSAGGAKRETDDAIPITVAMVEVVPMDQSLDVWGTLYAKDEATLGAEVEGKAEKTLVDFGDRVTAGQELALRRCSEFCTSAPNGKARVPVFTAGLIK